MQKLKRIFALIGAILLIGMYVITLVLGLTASPNAPNMLMASIACTVIIPCLIYGFMLVARVLDNRDNSEDKNEEEQS
ncbi:MAG: hypothetical protein Q4C61_17910 [Lachnospiraceae bacterium]|nr:hypothetical protein [Lachnospiraceae bacterium]